MQDPYVIMTTGFKNTNVGGSTKGYQLSIRMPYYRGTFLSLVHYLHLKMDGAEVPQANLRIAIGNRVFTIPQMEEAEDIRWDFGAKATLLVDKPGGLKPGAHHVEVGMTIRKSYLPPTDPERLYTDFTGLYKGGTYSTFLEQPTVVVKTVTLVQ